MKKEHTGSVDGSADADLAVGVRGARASGRRRLVLVILETTTIIVVRHAEKELEPSRIHR
jgi:hypothetical protein